MITDVRPLIEVNQQAINLLYKELGVVDAVRFLNRKAEKNSTVKRLRAQAIL
jgi:hypothetical protein